jgi:(p)ppGpp synthase/HD superfamily hydrolase
MIKLANAIQFAKLAHEGQTRKYNEEPYFNHPFRVMLNAVRYGCADEDMLCACVLHDVVEDTKYDLIDINMKFGQIVADLVEELTNWDDPSKNRAERIADREKKYLRMSESAAFVKMLDRIDNLKDIEKAGNFAKKYLQETKGMLEYFHVPKLSMAGMAKADLFLLWDQKNGDCR